MDRKRSDYGKYGSSSSSSSRYRDSRSESDRKHSDYHRKDPSDRKLNFHRREGDRNHRSRSPSHHGSYSSSRRSPSKSSYSSSRRRSRSTEVRGKSSDKRATSAEKSHEKRKTERQQLLEKWRKNYCKTSEDMKKKLEEFEIENSSWIRSSPADIYYTRTKDKIVDSTPRLDAICELFDENLIKRSDKVRAQQKPYNSSSLRKKKVRACRHKGEEINENVAIYVINLFSFFKMENVHHLTRHQRKNSKRTEQWKNYQEKLHILIDFTLTYGTMNKVK